MKNKKAEIFLIIISICLFYFALSFFITNQNFSSSSFPYYTYLAKSFLSGKLNVVPAGISFELSRFHNQYFLYWGPAPVLFVIPFYLLFGQATSDVLYTLVAGLLNVAVFYLLIKEFIKYFKLSVSLSDTLFVFLSFALASPNIFLSVVGSIWPTSRIISLFSICFILNF